MDVLATLGDAPTAAIAVIAIGLGLLFAARGPKGERRAAGGGAQAAPPTLLSVPVAPPAEPGFVGPQGAIVGHGPIHLGGGGPLGGPVEPAPVTAAAPALVPEEPAPAPVEPTPAPEEPTPVPEEPTPVPEEPARVPEAGTPIPFKQGTIKLGGRPAGRPPTG